MNHIHRSTATLLAALFVLLATPNATAQYIVLPDKAQGSFSTWGVGLTSRGAAHPVLIHAPGYNNGDPSEWDATLFGTASEFHPDYSTPMLTAWCPSNLPRPEFGDISTGNDLIPTINQDGNLVMTGLNTSHWYALTIAVASNAVGVQDSIIDQLLAANPAWNPASAILSYYAIGSTELNPNLADHVYVQSTGDQLNLGTISGGDGAIANLDYGVGVISTDPYNRTTPTFPKRTSFYFTLRKAWLQLPAIAGAGLTIGSAPLNSSTVYVMTWSSSGVWNPPAVAFSHTDLFHLLSTDDVEIDAISVDEGQLGSPACPRALVFSLTPSSDAAYAEGSAVNGPFDQILVWQRSTSNCASILTRTKTLMTSLSEPDPMPFSQRLGLRPRGTGIGPDNVTSTCGIDPRDGYAVQAVVGLATDQLSQGEGQLGLSAFRTCPGTSGNDVVTFQVTGLANMGYSDAVIQLHVEGAVYTQGQPPTGSFPVLDPVWIDDAAIVRNAIDIAVPMPHAISDPLTRLRVSAWALGYDSDQGDWVPIRQSWVITLGI